MFRHHFEYLCMWIHCVTIAIFGTFLGTPLLLYWIYVGSIYRYLSLAYFIYFYLTIDSGENGGIANIWLSSTLYSDLLRSYFPVILTNHPILEEDKNYIMGVHPHGLLTHSAMGYLNRSSPEMRIILRNHIAKFCTATYNVRIPIQREYFYGLGSISASEKSLRQWVSKPGGGHVAALVIGGPKEVFQYNKTENKLILKNKRGFCRVALKTGASLLPSFAFGEIELYDYIELPEGSVLRRVQDYVCNNLGVAVPLLKGPGRYHYLFVMPKRRPINIVFGKIVNVEPVENPTNEQIDDLHSRYVKEVEDIFNENKGKYFDDPNMKLVIV